MHINIDMEKYNSLSQTLQILDGLKENLEMSVQLFKDTFMMQKMVPRIKIKTGQRRL